jgi:hypothetical protein
MTWPGFSSVTAAWLFLLLIPLIIFYFLKLRRPQMELSSLVLWQQVINDQRVNSPFQKFRRNLLLLLQILWLACMAIAAMQPFWPSGADRSQAIPVLIDCSASMGAVDRQGGTTRLDAAKQEVEKLISGLLPAQRLSLIAVDRTARRITDFTDNQRVLREALAGLQVEASPSQLEDGLRMAGAMAKTATVSQVLLYTDGNVPSLVEYELPFRMNMQQVSAAGENLGITELNGRRLADGWEVFARLEGTAGMAGLVEVDLLANGTLLQTESVSVEASDSSDASSGSTKNAAADGAGGNTPTSRSAASGTAASSSSSLLKPARVTFRLETLEATSLELRIRPDRFDSLELDNTAFLELPAVRPLVVYCPVEMGLFREALAALPGLDVFPKAEAPDPQFVDLRFADDEHTSGPPAKLLLSNGAVPADLEPLIERKEQLTEVIDWQRTNPLLRHVQLLDVQLGEEYSWKAGIGERDLEAAGFEILAQSVQGPVIVQRAAPGQLEQYLLFHVSRSSLPYRLAFPILVANAVEQARDRAGLSEARSLPTGVLPPLLTSAEQTVVITPPQGSAQTVKSSALGQLTGIAAPQPGRYLFEAEGKTIAARGVSLLAPTETTLRRVRELAFPETTVATSSSPVAVDRPLWYWFAVLGLLFLLGEWWWFQKRPSGVPE